MLAWAVTNTPNGNGEVTIDGQRLTIMSSYSYLGLNFDKRVIEAGYEAAKTYGSGANGVRMLMGNLPIHHELESRLANLVGKEEALVFSSGFLCNIGVLSTLPDQGDVILIDELAHTSLQQGAMLSGADLGVFKHNDFEHAKSVLERFQPNLAPDAKVFVVCDSVYSMDGDVLDLESAEAFKRENGALLVVDEAHGLGAIGESGLGLESKVSNAKSIDIHIGTLSKAIPSMGGYVAGSSEYIGYLRYFAGPIVFSSPLSAFHCGVALEALRILEEEPQHFTRAQTNGSYLRNQLKTAGFDTGASTTPVVPLMLKSEVLTLNVWRELLDRGYFTAVVTSPAVGIGKARLRLSAPPTISHQQIDTFIETLSSLPSLAAHSLDQAQSMKT